MRRILVVDDDRTFADNLAELLGEDGFEARACYSAVEALAAVQADPPDLVITDVRMAGMDGLGMLAELRRTHPKVQSVVISGYADESAGGRAIGAGAHDYLSKPFTMAQLRNTMRWIVERVKTNQVVVSPTKQHPPSADDRWIVAEMRERAIRAFYVGVRSGAITSSTGYALWVALEQLDAKVADHTGLQTPEFRDAMLSYLWLHDAIEALAAPPHQRVRQAWFEDFCHQVREGALDAREFGLASLVRREPRGEWAELHQRLSRLG